MFLYFSNYGQLVASFGCENESEVKPSTLKHFALVPQVAVVSPFRFFLYPEQLYSFFIKHYSCAPVCFPKLKEELFSALFRESVNKTQIKTNFRVEPDMIMCCVVVILER